MDLQKHYDIAVIGSGIMGSSLAYFLSSFSNSKTILIEQTREIASHTSSRNTGKVHAPFLYNPLEKKLFSKAAFLGFDMLNDYCIQKSLPFKQDGVLEVATYDKGIDSLQKYLEWGYSNGLKKEELRFLWKDEVSRIEPNVRCMCAIYCSKDASVEYGSIARHLAEDSRKFGCHISVETKVKRIKYRNNNIVIQTNKDAISVGYLINAAGGGAIDIAHNMGVANTYADLHFRGEYWHAPQEYHNLTKTSIYSVPKYPEYPFLDPHWIIRVDGRCEIGPNAVPVLSPYAYNWSDNLKGFQKIFEFTHTGIRKLLLDKQFLSLAGNELKSSFSKTKMINRVKEFLPQLKPSLFIQKGISGIRSSLIDKSGKFVSDTMIVNKNNSLHVLNYNSPGATGALPMAAMIVDQLIRNGILSHDHTQNKSLWDIKKIADRMSV